MRHIGLLTAMMATGATLAYCATPQAAEIFFGAFPQPAGCTTTAGDEGAVCPNNITFNAGASGSFTATGINTGNPNTSSQSFLTFKGSPNPLDEQGLGENDTGPGTPCNTTDCEINRASSVAITSATPITEADIIVSSVQAGEAFNVWAGPAIGSLTEIASGLNNSNCNLFPGQSDVCVFTLATPEPVIALQSNNLLVGSADVLLAAVSTAAPSVPEPSTLLIVASALIGLSTFCRFKQTNRS